MLLNLKPMNTQFSPIVMTGLLACSLIATGHQSAHAGSLSGILPGTYRSELARLPSPDGRATATLEHKERHGLAMPPEPPKTLERWVRLRVVRDGKSIYDSGFEHLNIYQSVPGFAVDLMWSPDSAHLAYRHIHALQFIGLDGKVTHAGTADDASVASFRWINNEDLLVVSRKGESPLDLQGKPANFEGYTEQAKDIRISRVDLRGGVTELYRQAVSEPTFLFHAVNFALDEISPDANRVAFSDGADLCVYNAQLNKIVRRIPIPQKPAPKLAANTPGMEDPMIRSALEEINASAAQLEGVWWLTNGKLVIGVGILGGPVKAFYSCDVSTGALDDHTNVLLPLWDGNESARNYQDGAWYRSVLPQ